MPTQESSLFCTHCNARSLVRRKTMSHLLAGLGVAGLFVAGLVALSILPAVPHPSAEIDAWNRAFCLAPWWFALGLWAFASLSPAPWRCAKCGTPLAGTRWPPFPVLSVALVALFTVPVLLRLASK